MERAGRRKILRQEGEEESTEWTKQRRGAEKDEGMRRLKNTMVIVSMRRQLVERMKDWKRTKKKDVREQDEEKSRKRKR